jgi:glyoxylase I family protein
VITGIDHPGLSVHDLDRAIDFYCGIVGCELVAMGDFHGGAMSRVMGLEGTAGRSALLRVGEGFLELFEFAHPLPAPNTPPRQVCDLGIAHFGLGVRDINSEYQRLIRAGVHFRSEPITFATAKAAYAVDPEENAFELIERMAN